MTKLSLPACGADSLCIAALGEQSYRRLDIADGNALLCIFNAGELRTAQLYVAGKPKTLAATRWQSVYLLSLQWQGMLLQVCVAAGTLPAVEVLAATIKGRALVLSLATLLGKSWCDGYLAHINAGKILSYVARPGYLCLRLPLQIRAQGIDCLPAGFQQDCQQDYEYLALQQALRAAVRQQQLPLHVDNFSCAAAVCLVAMVKALACTAVQIEMPSPAWQRLLQNLGLRTIRVGKLSLSSLLPLVKTEHLMPIAAAINRRGAIIPASLVCIR